MDRRNLLKMLVKAGSAAMGAVLGIPALIYGLSPALKPRRGALWQPIGPLDDFPLGRVAEAVVEVPRKDSADSLRERGVYIWRTAEDEVVVFSRSCTDLGCPVIYDQGSGWFYCPCHGGIFDEEGQRRAGPPRRPLDRYAARIRDGVIEIDLGSVPLMV